MNELLTTRQTLSIVDSLRRTLRDAARQESVLRTEHDKELKEIRRRYGLLKERFRRQEAEAKRQAFANFEAEESKIRALNLSRKLRIQQAAERALATIRQSADQLRSLQKYENQKILLHASREHDAALQSAKREQQDFQQELQEEAERFQNLTDRSRRLFRGYASWVDLLRRQIENDAVFLSEDSDERAVLRGFRETVDHWEAELNQLSQNLVVRLFAWVRLWLILASILGVGGGIFWTPAALETLGISWKTLAFAMAGGCFGVLSLYGLGFVFGHRRAKRIAEKFWRAQSLFSSCQECANRRFQNAVKQIKRRFQNVESRLEHARRSADAEASRRLQSGTEKLEAQRERLLRQHERRFQAALASHRSSGGLAGDEFASELARAETEETLLAAEVSAQFRNRMNDLSREWRAKTSGFLRDLERSRKAGAEVFLDWKPSAWTDWAPAVGGEAAARFAELEVNLDCLTEELPQGAQSAWSKRNSLAVPLVVKMPVGETLLFETDDAKSGAEVISAMNGILLRLLTSSPAGKIALRIFDPAGLGQNFAGLMHLADYDEQIIHRRIWTQADHLDRCLRELTEHMEKVTQMCLRNEYETLAQYNEAAGSIAEKYHFLVVADFPVGFSEAAFRRLQSIVTSGPRCGVFLIVHRDLRQPLPDKALEEDLRSHCQWLRLRSGDCEFCGRRWRGLRLRWDALPNAELAVEILRKVGQTSADGGRVEVPFESVAPKADKLWSQRADVGVQVPIGRTGASKWQHLTLGKGTQQHVLIAGKTGSGKSTLFHVIATNLALWFGPDQVEFYLVDFKKGVEFQCYARRRLPHARVVAIESDREFGLSVLERVDEELRRRGELFRQRGVQDLPSYHKASPGETLPRTLVMIDEFQEYFVEEDKVSQNAAALLDRIIRQGRAFGIHMILGSQTLGGAYTLARTTLAQMAVRIALQCDEADACLIMDENNAAPKWLSRPGEGVYNDSGGVLEGNRPFQTVWLSDAERDCQLKQIRQLADKTTWQNKKPIIFEGNAPADIAENTLLAAALKNNPSNPPNKIRAWLGDPNAIKGPTEAVFELQNGHNLLILGQNQETTFSLVLCSIISLAAHYPAKQAQFWILDSIPNHAPHRKLIDRLPTILPHPIRTLKNTNLDTMMQEADAEKRRRQTNENTSPAIFLIVIGLQSFKKLRPQDEFALPIHADDTQSEKTATTFNQIIHDGGKLGIRTIATTDTYNNLQKSLNRNTLPEFEMRILLQMSANDSASLIDSTQANQLGLHRALLCHERKGWQETFRPYALPKSDWLAQTKSLFDQRQQQPKTTSHPT